MKIRPRWAIRSRKSGVRAQIALILETIVSGPFWRFNSNVAYWPTWKPEVIILLSSFYLTAALLVSINVHADSVKQIVGATEVIFIEEATLSFKARVDTGAKTSSIHAEEIEVNSSGDPQGKPISFYLVTKEGLSRKIETHIASVIKVRTSELSEHRYVVPLLMKWKDSSKTVLVSLNDRTKMEHRLLLGRNWLHGDFIVDVDINSED